MLILLGRRNRLTRDQEGGEGPRRSRPHTMGLIVSGVVLQGLPEWLSSRMWRVAGLVQPVAGDAVAVEGAALLALRLTGRYPA